jgi:hypothetical protein
MLLYGITKDIFILDKKIIIKREKYNFLDMLYKFIQTNIYIMAFFIKKRKMDSVL